MCPFPYLFPFYFDDVATDLITHQTDSNYIPYIKVDLTKAGSPSYSYYASDRVLQIDLHQDFYRDDIYLYLRNNDTALTGVDFKGYTVVVNFGLTIGGSSPIVAMAPQTVVSQTFSSKEGELLCILKCLGALSLMSKEYASKPYTAGGNAKVIVDGILKATLSPFSHCTPYDVVWHGDTGLSGINIAYQAETVAFDLNTTRMTAIRMYLDMSDTVMIPEADGKIHMRVPKTTGTDYGHEFALNGHTFFWKTRNIGMVIPNHINVKSQKITENGYAWDESTNSWYKVPDTVTDYEGDAYHDDYDIYPVSHFIVVGGAESNIECECIADGILAGIALAHSDGELEIPMRFYLRLGDYIKVTDLREGIIYA